jgi:hypothetical protein
MQSISTIGLDIAKSVLMLCLRESQRCNDAPASIARARGDGAISPAVALVTRAAMTSPSRSSTRYMTEDQRARRACPHLAFNKLPRTTSVGYTAFGFGGWPPRMIDPGDPSAMTDIASIQNHLTAITTAQTDFAKSSFEASKAYFERLAGEPDKFVELTTEYAKSAQDTFVAQATKIGELYKTFAKEAFTPFTLGFLPK